MKPLPWALVGFAAGALVNFLVGAAFWEAIGGGLLGGMFAHYFEQRRSDG